MTSSAEIPQLPPEWDQYLPPNSVFRTVFESSLAVMFLLEPETGRLIAANPAACRFYGYRASELTVLSPLEVTLLSRELLADRMHELKIARASRFATRHRLRNGNLRDMEFDATLIMLRDGRKCLLFIGHDTTDRRLAEEALQQREGLLQAILDSASDGIGFTDADGVYREVNPAFCRLAGQSCGSILGSRGVSYFDRRCRQAEIQMERRDKPEHAPASYELDMDGPDGLRHLSVHRSPVFNATGDFMGMVAISRDITARRSAEAALHKSESLHRAIFQSAQDSIFVTDENDVVCEVNQSLLSLTGLEREDVLGRHLSEMFPEPELRLQLSTSSLARETREPVSFTQRIQLAHPTKGEPGRPPRTEVWLSVVKSAIIDPEGNGLGVVSLGRDITSQRTSEVALRQNERRLSGLIRQAPVGVFETDIAGGLVFANERMQRQTGRTLAELSGSGWLSCVAQEDREDFLAAWRLALAHKRELDRELRLADERGTKIWVNLRARPMSDDANRLSGYLGVVSDISDRKKAEAMRADVESVVRHDLKSPLGSVQNAMELLPLLGPVTAEQEQVLTQVQALTKRMLGLIALSLDLHAMEAGLFKPAMEQVDLCDVVEEQRMELRGLLDGKRLEIEIVSSCPKGPFPVLGERRLLDAVFSNLLKNAAEAAPEDSHLTVTLSQEDGWAVARLRNPGSVPLQMRERFFEKYATMGKMHGTGLGTYSARLMVRTMGGRLGVDMGEPGATTLVLHLPQARSAPAGPPREEPYEPPPPDGDSSASEPV